MKTENVSILKVLYYITLWACSIGTIFVIDKQDFTIQFIISVIIIYFWQIFMYSKIYYPNSNKTLTAFDCVLCLILDVSIIFSALYFSYINFKFLVYGSLLFLLIVITNHFIYKWWRSIKIDENKDNKK